MSYPYAGGTDGQLIQEWCTPTRVMIWLDLWLVYLLIVLIELVLCGHMTMYR